MDKWRFYYFYGNKIGSFSIRKKFEKFRKSDNCYVCLTAEDDDTITIMRAYKYNGMYKDENELYIDDKYIDSKNGNKILFTQSENIEIDNYRYYYVKNNLTNEIEKEKSLLKDDSIEIGLFYNNFISPTQFDLEYFSNDEIEEKIIDFINKVEIETNNDEVKFTLNGSNNCFFGSNNDYDIKEVTIDYNTGFPTSYVSISDNKISREIFEYKTDTVTEDDFDISKYDDVEVTE